MDRDVIQAFKEANIEMAKGEPSATADHQACDVSPEFRDLTKGIQTCQNQKRECKNEVLEKNMKIFWADFVTYLNTSEELGSIRKMGPTKVYKDKVQYGLNILTYVFQNCGYCCPKKTRDGFQDCGQHVTRPPRFPIPGFEEATVDFDLILSKCYKQVDQETRTAVRDNVPLLVNLIRQAGRLKMCDFRDCGLIELLERKGFTIKDRDDSVLWQQHSCLLTHDNTQGEWSRYKAGQDPAFLQARRDEEATRKKLTKLLEKNEVKVRKQVEALAHKSAEKVRVSELSSADKRLYKISENARKESNRQEKAAKQQAKSAQLEEAKRTLLAMNGNEAAIRDVRQRLDDSEEDREEDSDEEDMEE